MATHFHPHLYFRTECRTVMTHCQAVFGGDLARHDVFDTRSGRSTATVPLPTPRSAGAAAS